jgi:hypothetical protein
MGLLLFGLFFEQIGPIICITTDSSQFILSCADGWFRGTSKFLYRLIVACYNLIYGPLISYTDEWLVGTILLITTNIRWYRGAVV